MNILHGRTLKHGMKPINSLRGPRTVCARLFILVRFAALLVANASKKRWPQRLTVPTILKGIVMSGVMDLVCAYGMPVFPRVKSKQNYLIGIKLLKFRYRIFRLIKYTGLF